LTLATLGKNLFVKGVIDEMQTFCVSNQNSIAGGDCCHWKGPLHTRETHYTQNCEFFKTPCLNADCSELVERKNMTEHFLNCPFRLSACLLCDQAVAFKDDEEHKTFCSFRLVCCGNNCGTVLPFNELKSHILKDCVLQPVECPLYRMGNCKDCNGRVPRNEILEHIAGVENLASTVVTLVTKMDGLLTENNILANKLDTVTSKLTEMDVRTAVRNTLKDLEFTFTQMLSTSKEKVMFPVFSCTGVCGIIRDWVRNDSNGEAIDPAVERINKQLYLQRRPLRTLHAAFEVPWDELISKTQVVNATVILTNENGNCGEKPTMSITKKHNVFDITCSLSPRMYDTSKTSLLFSYVCTFCVFNCTTNQPCSSESSVISDKMFFQFDKNMLFNYVSRKDNKLKILMTYFYPEN
jgi:hypothetical protein